MRLSFALYSKVGAITRIHCDPDGLTTAVKIASGCKLWAVMVKGSEEEGYPTASRDNLRNWMKAKWEVAVLSEGDIM